MWTVPGVGPANNWWLRQWSEGGSDHPTLRDKDLMDGWKDGRMEGKSKP